MDVEVKVNDNITISSVENSDNVQIALKSSGVTYLQYANGFDLITAINCCLMDKNA